MTKQAQRLQEHFVILNVKKQEKDYQNDQIIFKCSRKYWSDKKQTKETLNRHFDIKNFDGSILAFWHFECHKKKNMAKNSNVSGTKIDTNIFDILKVTKRVLKGQNIF